jgi:hypothetical protein
MNTQPPHVSVIDPISPAFERVRTILFRPFDLVKWLTIGFCAWLAYLGESGGSNFNFGKHGPGDVSPGEAIHQAKEFILDNLNWIVPLAIFGFIIGIAVWLLFTWLSSRGRFMFLHCVAQNKAEIEAPWKRFAKHANSLFLFRIVIGFIGLLIGSLLFLIGASVVIFSNTTFGFNIVSVTSLVIAALLFVGAVIVLLLVKKFTMDFVVPIMFLRTSNCVTGWRELLELLSLNKARFLLYVLFQIVIAITIGAIVIATVCLTCCCAGCILAIPYIGTVLLLPILIFERSYSLYYLQQFGPEFNVFIPEAQVSEIQVPDHS